MVDLDSWAAWTPTEVARRLQGFAAPWAVADGWAIELFAGEAPREHADLEIVIARDAFAALRVVLSELTFHPAGDGKVGGGDARLAATFQTWGLDAAVGCWRVDVMREPWSGQDWVYRRDPRVRRPLSEAIVTDSDGIPHLVPEIVLLFKAKRNSDTDQRDFTTALPRMTVDQRAWLTTALVTERPGHPWLAQL